MGCDDQAISSLEQVFVAGVGLTFCVHAFAGTKSDVKS
jgi:hypothetical protein